MKVDKGSDQKADIQPHWMAVHAYLKNEFTEDKKCQNLMSWLIYHFQNRKAIKQQRRAYFQSCFDEELSDNEEIYGKE